MKKEIITLAVEKITIGRQLREISEPAQAYQFEARMGLSKEAEHCIAELQDYLHDCDGIYEDMTALQKLEIDEELQNMLTGLKSKVLALTLP